jgi:cephalosporin-C deacetylase-like acetyl esterase
LSNANPFLYQAASADFTLRLIKQTKQYRHFSVTFPVASPIHYPGADTARGEYYEPNIDGKVPLIIQIHGWGDHSVIPFQWMLAGLLRKGIACFILYQPFHTTRLPQQMKGKLSHFTPEEWFTSYQMAVIDVRRIVDWAEENPHLDSSRISIMGISLGGFVASMAMSVEPRIKTGIFFVSGGNTGKIMQISRTSKFRKGLRLAQSQYQENQRNYYRYLAEVAEKGYENVRPAHPFYHIDPLTYAPMLKGRKVLMLNALWDGIIPMAAAQEFQQASGKGQLITYPATHVSIWFWYRLIMRQVNKFLDSRVI